MKRALVSEVAVATFVFAACVFATFAAGCGGGANDTGGAGNGAGGGAGHAVGGFDGSGGRRRARVRRCDGNGGGRGRQRRNGGRRLDGNGRGRRRGVVQQPDRHGRLHSPDGGDRMAPTPTGGTIADGTYVLTKFEVYSPLTPNANLVKATMKVTGKDLQWVSVMSTSASLNAQSYTTEIFGTIGR